MSMIDEVKKDLENDELTYCDICGYRCMYNRTLIMQCENNKRTFHLCGTCADTIMRMLHESTD